jgi:actin
MQLNLAGRDLTAWMVKLLTERGLEFSTSAEKEIVHLIKETLCYIALDFDEEMTKAASNSDIEHTYEPQDSNIISVGNERLCSSEMLFKPHFGGIEYYEIYKTFLDSIVKCNIDVWKDLDASIVLFGRTTLFSGLQQRIEKEVTDLAPPTMKIRVIASEQRKYAVWFGGSILSSLVTFPQMVITKDEYQESGP